MSTQQVRNYATAQCIVVQAALRQGIEGNSRGFAEKGGELYAKA